MMQLSHPHIVTIYGVCENKRLMMILELAELGSLLDYLLDYPERCQLPELYSWAMQVCVCARSSCEHGGVCELYIRVMFVSLFNCFSSPFT